MIARAAAFDDLYLPNKWMPFSMAIGFHVMLFIWNPTIMNGGSANIVPEILQVRFEEKLPPIVEQVKPKPIHKVIEKRISPKHAHKSGLSVHHKIEVVAIHHPAVVHTPPVHHTFVSKITMPKFVPHDADEPIAASVSPGISAPAPHPMTQAYAPVKKLRGKTRGVRASDINFELSDRGSLAASEQVVAIPIGQESGETAVLPNAQVLHDSPKGIKTISGYKYQPGMGEGSGELHGKNGIGFHGAVHADAFVEGSLEGGAADTKVTGKGFEIGGPVGDRKIIGKRLPEYPSWAEEKGISALVKIYFTVRPDGTIRQAMRIVTSSGYAELDSLAKDALSQWRFTPTSAASSAQEAWGVITFRFTLS